MSPQPWPILPAVSTAIVASPAAAAETTVAQVTVSSVGSPTSLVELSGWAAFVIGATGTAIRMRIRRGSLTGTVAADSGALTAGVAAAALVAQDVEGTDSPGEVESLLYVLTLQVTGGSSASTLSAVKLKATVLG